MCCCIVPFDIPCIAAVQSATLKHVIRIQERSVADVTSNDSLLFVLCSPSQQQIQAFDKRTFKQERALRVKYLSDDTSDSGLTSCVTNNCLYVSDHSRDTIYKVELSGDKKVSNWRVDSHPCGLSINAACNLLVACCDVSKIQEYTASGSLVREICLKSNTVTLSPLHALQLTDDRFAVCCMNETHKMFDVVEIDARRRVVISHSNLLQPTARSHSTLAKLHESTAINRSDGVLLATSSIGG
jgi:hypothetical protein